MRLRPPFPRPFVAAFAAATLLLTASCVDAPSAPDGYLSPSFAIAVAPSFALDGPARSTAASDALDAAFDKVDRFRLQITRVSTNEVILTTTVEVTPGQDQYELSAEVSGVTLGESLLVRVTALQGTTVLFESAPIPVTAQASASSQPQTVNAPLTYTGPGATATDVALVPAGIVLAPGGSGSLAARVTDQGGAVVANVPLAWAVDGAPIVTVGEDGTVSATSAGMTMVTATTPTGLTAAAHVYVVSGAVTYVAGGQVVSRAVGGGEVTTHGPGAMPAYSPDGSRLLVDIGGGIAEVGSSTPLFGGSAAAVSPDQTKIAASGLVFANADGSNATDGPAGGNPQWISDSELVVDGGSVERIRADGSGRTSLSAGGQWPAVSPSGQIAWVDGGSLVVEGGDALMTGVDSRPAWSGSWLIASAGGELHVVPADGSGPALPIGASGTFPAVKPSGGGAPAALQLTGLAPAQVAPGAEVDILGSGFDWIIQSNNRAFFPGPEGETEAEVLGVTEGALKVRTPNRLSAGNIRVTTWQQEATLPFEPPLGSVSVTATRLDDKGVAGVLVRILDDAEEKASGTTDASGSVVLPGLPSGSYTVSMVPPSGHRFFTPPPGSVTVEQGVASALEAKLMRDVVSLTVSPMNPELLLGEQIEVKAVAKDINGEEITVFKNSGWASTTGHLGVGGTGLSGTLVGAAPSPSVGGAQYRIFLNDQVFLFDATVRSHIAGIVQKQAPSSFTSTASLVAAATTDYVAVEGVTLELVQGSSVVGTASSGADGRFRFDNLLGGQYVVRPLLGEGKSSSPASSTVDLGLSTPSGNLSFTIFEAVAGAGDLITVNDWNVWDTGSNGPTLVQNFVATANNSGTKVVWWCGRQANPFRICQSSINSDGSGQFRGTRDHITAAGWQFEVDYQTPLTDIPADVRVFWMWTPTEQLTNEEVNVLKSFSARGGRIIFNADFKESWYTSSQHADIATRLFGQLGANIVSVGELKYGTVVVEEHPIMSGVTTVNFGAPGDFTLSPPAVPLVSYTDGTVLIAYSSVDPTPLPPSPASLRAPARPTSPAAVAPSNCVPGTVCGAPASSDRQQQDEDRDLQFEAALLNDGARSEDVVPERSSDRR